MAKRAFRVALTAALASLCVACNDDSGSSANNQAPASAAGDAVDGSDEEGALRMAFETQPADTVAAGDPFDVELRVSTSDGHSTDVPGIDVTLGLLASELPTDDGELTATTGTDGIAAFSPSVEQAGSLYVLRAEVDHDDREGSVESDPFEVVASFASAENSSITGEDGATADGETPTEVVVTVADEYGNPLIGVVPQFEATGGGNDYGDCSRTNVSGEAFCEMRSTEPGEKTLQLVSPVVLTGDTIGFLPNADRPR